MLDEQCPSELLLPLTDKKFIGSGTHGLQIGLEKNMRILILSGSTSTSNVSPVERDNFVQFFVEEARRWYEELTTAPKPEKLESMPNLDNMLCV